MIVKKTEETNGEVDKSIIFLFDAIYLLIIVEVLKCNAFCVNTTTETKPGKKFCFSFKFK